MTSTTKTITLCLVTALFLMIGGSVYTTTVAHAQEAGIATEGDGRGGTVDRAVTPTNTAAPSSGGAPRTYQPLVGIPGISNAASDFGKYINQLFFLSISIAALLAVIKIILAGVQWMLSDVVTSKSQAKADIWGAVLGLLIIVSSVLILNTINPNLTKLNVLAGAQKLGAVSSPIRATTPPPTALQTEQARFSQSPDNVQAVNQAMGSNIGQLQTGTDRGGTNTFTYISANAPREVLNGYINSCQNVTQGQVGQTNTVRKETYNNESIYSCYRSQPGGSEYRVQLTQ